MNTCMHTALVPMHTHAHTAFVIVCIRSLHIYAPLLVKLQENASSCNDAKHRVRFRILQFGFQFYRVHSSSFFRFRIRIRIRVRVLQRKAEHDHIDNLGCLMGRWRLPPLWDGWLGAGRPPIQLWDGRGCRCRVHDIGCMVRGTW